jgi:hypothetical protein
MEKSKKVQKVLMLHKIPFSGEQIVKINLFRVGEEVEEESFFFAENRCAWEQNFKHVHTIKASMIDCWLLKTNYRSI